MVNPAPPTRPASDGSRRPGWLVPAASIALLAGAAVAAFGLWYIFIGPPAPAAIGTSAPVIPSNAPVGSVGTTDGTWTVDTSVGTVDDGTGTFVGYQVKETLANIGAKTAVGRTGDVTGSLTLEGSRVTAGEIEANLQTLRSDEAFRDQQLARQSIETSTFPTATFTLTQPIELGTVPADGQTVSATATGELTLHGVTKTVQVPLKATRTGDLVGVSGSIDILFADYDIAKPEAARVLSVEDRGVMEFQVFFRKD